MKTMKAVLYTAPGRANGSVTQVPYPKCGPDQIIIKVVSSGICKAADRTIDEGRSSTLDVYPIVPGHEFAGYVEEIGSNVKNFKVGDRVTADNTLLCGDCYFCRRDMPIYCDNFGSLGHNIFGGQAEYVLLSKDKVFQIPDNVSFNAASITEPVACAMHAIDRMNIQYGEHVLVLGAGAHGQILAMLAHHSNAAYAACVAPTQWKLDLLNKEGVNTIRMDRSDYSVHESAILDRFPHGVDKIIDTTGSGELGASAIKLLRKGGCLYTYSEPYAPFDLFKRIDVTDFYFRELSLIATGLQTHNYDRSLEAMSSGKVNAEMLVTHEYALDDYFTALDYNLQHGSEVIKVVIHPWDNLR